MAELSCWTDTIAVAFSKSADSFKPIQPYQMTTDFRTIEGIYQKCTAHYGPTRALNEKSEFIPVKFPIPSEAEGLPSG
jgi:hypothetical protein